MKTEAELLPRVVEYVTGYWAEHRRPMMLSTLTRRFNRYMSLFGTDSHTVLSVLKARGDVHSFLGRTGATWLVPVAPWQAMGESERFWLKKDVDTSHGDLVSKKSVDEVGPVTAPLTSYAAVRDQVYAGAGLKPSVYTEPATSERDELNAPSEPVGEIGMAGNWEDE